MINPREWLRTRKNLLDQVKNQVRLRLGPLPPTLRRYARDLDADFKGAWTEASAQDLKRAFKKSKIILSADFHAYAQSQRAHVRLLRDHAGQGEVIVALECIGEKYDGAIEDFLSGRLTEKEFLEEVEWEKNWGFPWEHYRPLFELARDRGFRVSGLGRKASIALTERDRQFAKRILRWREESPSALIFAVIGEWHLAKSHLPRALQRNGEEPSRITVIFQDVEKLYFRIAKTGRETTSEILKASGQRFCLMVSPPWMKWQSYSMYLEETYDRDLQEEIAIDYSDHVLSLVEILEADLKIELKKSHLQVYCANSKASLSRLRVSLSREEEKAVLYHLENGQSFFVPQKGWLYLSRATMNHASNLAGQFVHAQLNGRTRTLWKMPDDFLGLIWIETVGFFFSKWINPKRKAETLESIRLQLAARHPRDLGRGALLLALDQRLSEVLLARTGRLRRARYRPKRSTAYLDAARIVGSMMGERLFQKVRSGTISFKVLMSYLRMGVDDPGFSKFFWKLIREIESDQPL